MEKSRIAFGMRLLAGISFMVAAIVMLRSNQIIDVGNTHFIIKCNDWSGLMFCISIDFIGMYNFLVLFIPNGDETWRRVIVFDVIMNILIGAILGAGWQTYVLIGGGSRIVGWAPICEVTSLFCNRVLGSLITSTFGFINSFGLLMWSVKEATFD